MICFENAKGRERSEGEEVPVQNSRVYGLRESVIIRREEGCLGRIDKGVRLPCIRMLM